MFVNPSTADPSTAPPPPSTAQRVCAYPIRRPRLGLCMNPSTADPSTAYSDPSTAPPSTAYINPSTAYSDPSTASVYIYLWKNQDPSTAPLYRACAHARAHMQISTHVLRRMTYAKRISTCVLFSMLCQVCRVRVSAGSGPSARLT
jgi:hypothetical protein